MPIRERPGLGRIAAADRDDVDRIGLRGAAEKLLVDVGRANDAETERARNCHTAPDDTLPPCLPLTPNRWFSLPSDASPGPFGWPVGALATAGSSSASGSS